MKNYVLLLLILKKEIIEIHKKLPKMILGTEQKIITIKD